MNHALLKFDSKQKIRYGRAFLSEMKSDKEASPFFTLDPNEIGFFDFGYIVKKRITIQQIEKNLKDNRYESVRDFCDDIKLLLTGFADYLLSDDPIQQTIINISHRISNFQGRFQEQFYENKSQKSQPKVSKKDKQEKLKEKQKEKERQKQKTAQQIPQIKKSTFGDKIQMFYLLRAHEDNAEYIRSIGETYGIGRQTEDQYIIRMEFNASSCPWLQLLQKKTF